MSGEFLHDLDKSQKFCIHPGSAHNYFSPFVLYQMTRSSPASIVRCLDALIGELEDTEKGRKTISMSRNSAIVDEPQGPQFAYAVFGP